jgi:hypothetical protein
MSDQEDDQKKSSINWGGLAKGLLAGAAIVAGVMIVCPQVIAPLITAVKSIVPTITAAGQTAASTPGVAAAIEPNFFSQGIGSLIVRAAGAVMAFGGAHYLLSNKEESPHSERMQRAHEAQDSFAVREDMRRMQGLMVARMQANNYQPAMALANQQGRC